MQIAHFSAVFSGFEEAQRGGLFIGQRQVETIAERDQRLPVELLLLVHGHLALPGIAHAEAFLGLRQNHRGLSALAHRALVGGENLHHVVATAFEAVDLFIGQALGQMCQGFVLAKELIAVETPVFGSERLELAIDRGGQGLDQRAVVIPGKQSVPVRAPDQFDDVPAGPTEQRLQLVDDATVAPHRTVQTLKVAVDHPHQIIQPFACRQRQGRHAFRLIHFTVAEHPPNGAPGGVLQAAVFQVTHETRLVDRADRTDAHRAGRELPEVRHQPRMRITRQAPGAIGACADLLPVMLQVLLFEAAFQKSPCINARRRVRLVEHQIAAAGFCARPEEVVEAHFKQIGGARVAGDVAAEFPVGLVGSRHHDQRVPAHDRGQAFFERQIPREHRLLLNADGIDVGRAVTGSPIHLAGAGQRHQHVHDLPGLPGAAMGDDR
ncbi:hypothetical protein D3C84_415140 [compost metagenome]